MTLCELGAAYAFLIPQDPSYVPPYTDEQINNLDKIRERIRKKNGW